MHSAAVLTITAIPSAWHYGDTAVWLMLSTALRGLLHLKSDNIWNVCCLADCCDGSDESSGKCGNTCAQAGAAARAELKAKAAREAAGAKVKEGYMKQAQEDKRGWQDEAQKLTQQIVQKQKLVDQWKGAHSQDTLLFPRHRTLCSVMKLAVLVI